MCIRDRRSADAFTFELAGSVFGAGNSQVALNYEFFDMHPYSGTSYYRLKQVDFDGTFTYSDIVPVHNPNGSDASITVFPNPTQGETIVSIQGTSEGTIELSAVSYTHLRAHETVLDLVCRLLLENKNTLH